MWKCWLFLILLIPFVGAVDISLTSPERVEVNKSFEVTVGADVSDDYDVKLFLHDGEYSNIISEIEKDGDWSNPYYYLKGVFPGEKEFTLRVLSGVGERELCGRLRKTGGSGFDQTCLNLTVLGGGNVEMQEGDTGVEEEDEDEEPDRGGSGDVGEADEVAGRVVVSSHFTGDVVEDGPIVLNPVSSSDNSGESVFVTSTEKRRLWLIYGFTGLALVVVLLLSLRRL